MRRVSTAWLLILLCGSLAWAPRVAAAANPIPGISLSPFEEQLTIEPTDTAKSFNLVLGNHTPVVQYLNLKTQDFGTLGNTGGIRLENNSYTKRYGLAAWLSLGKTSVSLTPGQTATVAVTIHNRLSLGPGGHYGAIVVGVGNGSKNQGSQVAINQQLLSLILVDKVGGDHYDLALTGVTSNGNLLRAPTDVRLSFQNPGNVHVIPRGLVKLTSPTGTIVAQGVINTQSAFILPGTSRELHVSLTALAKAAAVPGPYRLTAQYRYDGITTYATKHYFVDYLNVGSWAVLGVLTVVGFGWTLTRRPRRPTA